MNTVSHPIAVEKNNIDINKTLITNTIKMLTNRGLLSKEKLKDNIKNILKEYSEENKYSVKLDKVPKGLNDTALIQITKQNVGTINKTSAIFNFLNTYKKHIAIIIAPSISKRALEDIESKYENTEIFIEHELMINLVDNALVPEHELLTSEEEVEFFKAYNVKKKNMPKVYLSDPVSRYYNAKVGNVFRIKRPSPTSGYAIDYRLVIKGGKKK